MRYVIVCITLLLLIVLNIFCGSVSISPSEVMQVIMGNGADSPAQYIIVQNRLPQMVTAMLAGAGLGAAGLMLQTAFHNPLAGPSVLGISSGASLGVAIVMLIIGGAAMTATGYVAVIVAALVGALAVTALLLLMSAMLSSKLTLLIGGLMISYLVSSVITLLTYSATATGIQTYVIWGMGDFSLVSLGQLPWFAIVMIAALLMCFPLMKPLSIMQLGEAYAQSLGINIEQTRRYLLLLTGILTATITAFCGPIAFLGLAVPHIVRLLLHTDSYQRLLPTTMLCGATMALLCNLICTLPSSGLLPLAAVTPIIGAPIILYVILHRQ